MYPDFSVVNRCLYSGFPFYPLPVVDFARNPLNPRGYSRCWQGSLATSTTLIVRFSWFQRLKGLKPLKAQRKEPNDDRHKEWHGIHRKNENDLRSSIILIRRIGSSSQPSIHFFSNRRNAGNVRQSGCSAGEDHIEQQ